MSLLTVSQLKVWYSLNGKWLRAVDGVDLRLEKGESLGIIGESGCGKSSLLAAISGLIPSNAKVVSGECVINGNNIYTMTEEELCDIRWVEMAVVFQGAMNALNPVIKVGDLIAEAYRRHTASATTAEAKQRVNEVLEIVDLPARVGSSYAHELSGGMRQRAIIALALVCSPALLLADEPTTALDVVVQDEVLAQIREIQAKLGFGLILVSHDVSVIAETCERVAVMYGGRIVESGDTGQVFSNPRHPYSAGLLNSFLSLDGDKREAVSIPGYPPRLIDPPDGCRFSDRCPRSDGKLCVTVPAPRRSEGNHDVFCHYAP